MITTSTNFHGKINCNVNITSQSNRPQFVSLKGTRSAVVWIQGTVLAPFLFAL